MSQSLWRATLPEAHFGAALDSDIEVDFAIAGGGFTGLWTAYWLKRLEPTARIAVFERDEFGEGASGRNGGWFSALFPADLDKLALISGRESAVSMQLAMQRNLDVVEEVLSDEAIGCDWQRGGTVTAIRSSAQEQRATAEVRWWRDWGFGERDVALLDRVAAEQHVRMTELRGATYTPHCARVQPLKLVRGLAAACKRNGVQLFEKSTVTAISATAMQVNGHCVTASRTVRALEAYTADLHGQHRTIAPVYSLMVATPQLPPEVWSQIGLEAGETFADYRHVIIYGQRTADDRIAFGGRGAPYHFGSRLHPDFELHERTHTAIWRELIDLFPVLRSYSPEFKWGGALAIARDWNASVNADPGQAAAAGGYVGDGLGTSALAGRTLAHLLCEQPNELTALPWVGHRSRKWEPEPLRWLGVNAGLRTMFAADAEERITGRPSRLAAAFNRWFR